jgi:excisionase family DNA binding protein
VQPAEAPEGAPVAYTADETARIIRESLNTTYLLLAQGKIPGVKIGHQWRVSKAALEAFLAGE